MKDYFHKQGRRYEPEQDRYGHLSIEVFPFLIGKPWDEVALAYVSALKPGLIRVIRYNEMQTADAQENRVTVNLDEGGLISGISQEVRVWLPEGVAHGMALRMALQFGGINSPQCAWHNDDQISSYFMDGINGKYYKVRKNGESIPFPD